MKSPRSPRHPLPSRVAFALLGALAVSPTVLLPTAGGAQEPDPRADPRLGKELALEVRAAGVGDVLGRLSTALGVGLEAEPVVADQRVTVHARKTTIQGVQTALTALLKQPWKLEGAGVERRYRLSRNPAFEAQVERLRQERHTGFLSRLRATEAALRGPNPEAVAETVRASVAKRFPYLPEASLAQITPDYLRQAMLVLPLRPSQQTALAQTRFTWNSFRQTPAWGRQLLSGFVMESYEGNTPTIGEDNPAMADARPAGRSVGANPYVLNFPQARAEYRLLYGDRWTGTLLMTRVGAADNWATAYLPSVLYDLPDFGSLYPEAQRRVLYPELSRKVDFRFDTTGQAFDQALLMLARKAEINVACDAYPRPELFGPAGARPVLAAATLGEALDQLTTYYGYVYWKLGDFYLFRSRNWADEQRVAVPDRVLQSLTAGVAWPDSLSSGELLALAALTDEQLLTLHLTGRANGGATVAAEAFDLNEVHLARSGLVMFSQLTPSQRSLARTRGIPLRLLPAGPRALFAAAAYDRNITLDPADEGSGFRIIPPPSRQAGAAGPSSNVLQFIFDFGEPGIRRSDLSLWLPAPPRAAP